MSIRAATGEEIIEGSLQHAAGNLHPQEKMVILIARYPRSNRGNALVPGFNADEGRKNMSDAVKA
jgi:hypothetical protein